MARTLKTPTFLAASLILASIAGQGAFADVRQKAPIRFGPEKPVVQQVASGDRTRIASVQPSSRLGGQSFFYPDEAVRTPRAVQIADRSVATPSPVITAPTPQREQTVSQPAEVVESSGGYFKIGNPYTINGLTYVPAEDPFYDETGVASWYGPNFHGKATANGETYDMYAMTAAHPTLPLPSLVKVQNLENGKEVVVRLNDRGPFAKDRVIDLSKAAAEAIGMIEAGTAKVRVTYVGPAGIPGPKSAVETPQIAQKSPESVRTASAQPGYYVQLGSFSDRANAEKFKAQLSSTTDQVDVVYARVDQRDFYRVVVGPFAEKASAEMDKNSLARAGFQGLVIASK